MSPSLDVCGDVLDRVHYQMAEANLRPVLPASAKAIGAGQPLKAVAGPVQPSKSSPPPPPVQSHPQSQSQSQEKDKNAGSMSGNVAVAVATSLVSSSTEALANSMRKMLATSSATINRKLTSFQSNHSSSPPPPSQPASITGGQERTNSIDVLRAGEHRVAPAHLSRTASGDRKSVV